MLPRETGGVERGTVDITMALTAAGRRAIVVSAGGSIVREIERVGERISPCRSTARTR